MGHNFETIINGEMLGTPTQYYSFALYDDTGQKSSLFSSLFDNSKHHFRH